MDVSVTVATLLGLTALFNFLNERFLRLQQTIGLMLIALDGWEAGVDADVTVVDIGATGSPDTATAQSPVIGFNFGEEGLMAGVSVKGTKVTKLDLEVGHNKKCPLRVISGHPSI